MVPWKMWGPERQDALFDRNVSRAEYSERRLGSGTYGDVYLFRHLAEPEEYAVKVMKENTELSTVIPEVSIRNLNHPNITGTCKLTDFGGAEFAMFMDRANFDLEFYIDKMREAYNAGDRSDAMFDDRKIAAFQVANAVAYTISRLIVHCDIKPANFLVYGHQIGGLYPSLQSASPTASSTASQTAMMPRVMLTDFGISHPFAENEPKSDALYTMWWRAPEIVFGSGRATMASEVWACGCVIYELLAFRSPFGTPGNEFDQASEIVKRIGVPSPREIPAIDTYRKWNAWRARILKEHGAANPSQNTFKTDLADFPGAYELVSKMLSMAPDARPTIYQVLDDPFFASETFRNRRLLPATARDFVYAHLDGSRVLDVPRFDPGKRFYPESVVAAHRRAQRLPLPFVRWNADQKSAYTDMVTRIYTAWKKTSPQTSSPDHPLLAIDIARRWFYSTRVSFPFLSPAEQQRYIASFLNIAYMYVYDEDMPDKDLVALGTTWSLVVPYEQRILIDIDFDVYRPGVGNVAERLVTLNLQLGAPVEYDVLHHFALMMLRDIDFSYALSCYDIAIQSLCAVSQTRVVTESEQIVGLSESATKFIVEHFENYLSTLSASNAISAVSFEKVKNICNWLRDAMTI
jgi:serine/threonine protein kinase